MSKIVTLKDKLKWLEDDEIQFQHLVNWKRHRVTKHQNAVNKNTSTNDYLHWTHTGVSEFPVTLQGQFSYYGT